MILFNHGQVWSSIMATKHLFDAKYFSIFNKDSSASQAVLTGAVSKFYSNTLWSNSASISLRFASCPFCVSWEKKHCFNQQQEVLLQSNIQCKLLALRIQGKLNTVMAVNFYRSCHSFFDHSLVQNDVVCNNVFMSIFYPRFTFFRCHPLS